MARVIGCFERADQVGGSRVGETAKGGDGSLELHEFLSTIVMLAFARANPKFGEVGHTDASAVELPLPDCLQQMLTKCLLQSAKRDSIVAVKASITEEPDVQVALWNNKAALLKWFKQITHGAKAVEGQARRPHSPRRHHDALPRVGYLHWSPPADTPRAAC